MATEGSQRQDSCEGCDFVGVSYFCDTCPAHLCCRCAESHRRFNGTKSHFIRKINDADAPYSSEPAPTNCLAHPSEPLTKYCDTCDDILCGHCHKSSHSNHKVTLIDERKTHMQKLCIDNLSKLFDTTTKLKTNDDEITILNEKYISGLRNVKKELLERKTKLHVCIDTSYKHSITKVDAEISRVQMTFDTFKNQKKESRTQAEQLDVKLAAARRHDDEDILVDALREFKLVHPKLQRVAKMKDDKLITVYPGEMLASDGEVENAKLSVETVLSINMQQKKKTDATIVSQVVSLNTPAHDNIVQPTKRTDSDNMDHQVAQKKRPMLFHTTHGNKILLSSNKEQAKYMSHGNAICFGDRPIALNEKIYIRMRGVRDVVFSFTAPSLGFTSDDPATIEASSLPRSALYDLTNKPGWWAARWPKIVDCSEGSIFHFYVTSAGEIKYGVNGRDQGVLLNGVNTTARLWPIVDTSGRITTMEFVDK